MDRKLTIEKVCCMNFLLIHLIAERNELKKKEACNKQATEIMHAEEIFKHSMSNASNVSVVPPVNVEALSPTPPPTNVVVTVPPPLSNVFASAPLPTNVITTVPSTSSTNVVGSAPLSLPSTVVATVPPPPFY